MQLKGDAGVTSDDGHPTMLLPIIRASTLDLEAGQAGLKSRVFGVLRLCDANSFPSCGPMVENKKNKKIL